MKKKEFEQLKQGDTVTVRTVDEMLALKNTYLSSFGCLSVETVNGQRALFVIGDASRPLMERFCGKEYPVFESRKGFVVLGGGACGYMVSRKMLRGTDDHVSRVCVDNDTPTKLRNN